ncbi:DNA-binding CsgD family transcriptional regulator/tetratricopeptide (TPR) repeat protein [Actinoplanes tereljensis]|uniref:Helix-turn-helix transcriptional regulator n=1 Tax=Paractinoplanes tereljensis TaxID=571912 RepID=A0A919NM44_9ACTN|nr:helix-turn-helix transcriptional regulator [Actinoplanes tereljensis]GIF21038.1 helix-turn-helix transcriptional regulator [Actinoplanes tereljensis]
MTAHVHSEVLVGREADLTLLRDALKRARSAEPSTLLVGGEAGVGKTRLVEEFCRTLAGEQVRVLTGQCLELGEEGLPFAPFAAAVRALVRAEGPAVLDGREREFARLLPELGPPGDARRGLLFESVGALFERVGADQPIVLVLEDLHWADRATRDLIGYLTRSARVPQLLLIGTYRTDELQRGHPLRPFLAELDRVRGVQRHELDRLDREGTAELLTQLLGVEPGASTVDAVNERAQGNPFFIEQFAAAADPACGDIPTSLRDLLLSRVDLLPEPAQRVLRVAAVGGTRFGHELLARVAGIDEGALESALRTIVAAQLIVFDPDGGYEFRHALVREAVHDDLLPGEHARLHGRYAEAIEAEPQLVPAGRAPAELAHHWLAARDHPKALTAAKLAADAAGRSFAYGEQARLLERVLELWEDVPQAGDLLGIEHLDLLEEAALVAIDSGDHHRALSLTRAALGDLDAEGSPLRAARLLLRRVKLLRNAGKSDGAPECAEAYRLLGVAPPGAERVRLLADLVYVYASIDPEQAGRVALEAQAAAVSETPVDLSAIVAVEVAHGAVCSGRLSPADAMPTLQAAADRARAAGDVSGLTYALVTISDALYALGHYEESAAAAAEGVPHADRVGVSRTTGVFLRANHAEALIALGRWDEADARLAEAARHDPPGRLALPWVRQRAWLRLARGQDGAEPLVRQAAMWLGKAYLQAENRLYLLELHILRALAARDLDAAVTVARTAVAEPCVFEQPRYSWPLLASAARAAASAGDSELVSSILTVAARVPARHPAELAYATYVRAVLEGGVSRWRAAVEAWRADGHRYELALALLGLAEAQAADRGAAAETLGEVSSLAEALGAGPLLEAADTLGRRLGVRAAVSTVAGAAVLTAREREVLRLVAEGQSNSRIATSLYISPKTASVHVSRIIAKLEVANRTEAAAVAHRLGLLSD